MVFGLVLGFLEGRRLTEAMTAGLCASFILADGVTKSVGAWLLEQGVPEDWMPSAAGLLFLTPLCIGVAMLARIPAPNKHDIAERTARYQLNRNERWSLYGRYAGGLTLLVTMYLLLTVLRSVRADFAPELWRGLGEPAAPSMFTRSELLVTLGILMASGCTVFVRDNRAGVLCLAGDVLQRVLADHRGTRRPTSRRDWCLSVHGDDWTRLVSPLCCHAHDGLRAAVGDDARARQLGFPDVRRRFFWIPRLCFRYDHSESVDDDW